MNLWVHFSENMHLHMNTRAGRIGGTMRATGLPEFLRASLRKSLHLLSENLNRNKKVMKLWTKFKYLSNWSWMFLFLYKYYWCSCRARPGTNSSYCFASSQKTAIPFETSGEELNRAPNAALLDESNNACYCLGRSQNSKANSFVTNTSGAC